MSFDEARCPDGTTTVRLSSCLAASGAKQRRAMRGPVSAVPRTATSPALILAHSGLLRSGGGGPRIVINGVTVGEDGSTNQRHEARVR